MSWISRQGEAIETAQAVENGSDRRGGSKGNAWSEVELKVLKMRRGAVEYGENFGVNGVVELERERGEGRESGGIEESSRKGRTHQLELVKLGNSDGRRRERRDETGGQFEGDEACRTLMRLGESAIEPRCHSLLVMPLNMLQAIEGKPRNPRQRNSGACDSTAATEAACTGLGNLWTNKSLLIVSGASNERAGRATMLAAC